MNPRTIAIFGGAALILIAVGVIALVERDVVGWIDAPRPIELPPPPIEVPPPPVDDLVPPAPPPLRLPKAVSTARPRLSAPQLIESGGELRTILAPAVAPAHLGCQRLGSFVVRQRAPSSAQLRLSACRGTAAGCAGHGSNWLLVRTCRSGSGGEFEGCVDTPVFASYGHFSVSRAIDVSEAFTGGGTYTSYLCDAGCAAAPSEKFGPCCNPASCSTCMSPVATHCPAMADTEYSYGHLDWVEYRVR